MRFLVVAAALAALLFTTAPAWPALAQEAPGIVLYQQVRCGEDRDVYGRVNFPPATPSFSVYLQERVPATNNAGFEWRAVINSHDNLAPAPTDTSADFGPLDTANVSPLADRLRIANTLTDDVSQPVIPCQITTTPTATATLTPSPTATATPAPTQTPVTPVVVTATFTPSPIPTQPAPAINVNVYPDIIIPQGVLPAAPAPSQPIATPAGGGLQVRPPNTGSGGLATP